MIVLADVPQDKKFHNLSMAMALEKGIDKPRSDIELDLDPTIVTVPNKESTTSSDQFCGALGKTKLALSFSVDRLLNCQQNSNRNKCRTSKELLPETDRNCCDSIYSCCNYTNCLVGAQHDIHRNHLESHHATSTCHLSSQHNQTFEDIKSILRPTPIRAQGNSCGSATLCPPLTSPLLQFHQQKLQQQQKLEHTNSHFQRPVQQLAGLVGVGGVSPLVAPLSGLKSLQINHQATQLFRQTSTHFQSKAYNNNNITAPASNICGTSAVNIAQHTQQQPQKQQQQQNQPQLSGGGSVGCSVGSISGSSGKRKRSWSRAVFSNLQRKGLEIQFQQQKYITKPDRRKLAARLNLTDAQVKVWFQNRRMKWRHTRENLKSGQEKQIPAAEGAREKSNGKAQEVNEKMHLHYSSDASSSVEMSDNEDEDEIDVVE